MLSSNDVLLNSKQLGSFLTVVTPQCWGLLCSKIRMWHRQLTAKLLYTKFVMQELDSGHYFISAGLKVVSEENTNIGMFETYGRC